LSWDRCADVAERRGIALSKFLTYWSLTFAILLIWGFSIAVALADVKDELLEKIRKQVGRARLRPIDPLAGQSVAETLAPSAMDERERWVFHLVSEIAIALKLNVKVLVLQDSMGHYLVHFAQGKRLTSYRVDKAWVADAMAGKAEARERTYVAVDQYLRQEFLGQKIPPKMAPAAAAKTTAAAGTSPKPTSAPAAASGAAAPAKPAPEPGAAAGTPVAAAQPSGTGEMSREEKIAAAKAKAEAIKAQRAAGESPKPSPAPEASAPETPAPAAASGAAAPAKPAPEPGAAAGTPGAAAQPSGTGEMSREEKIAAAKAKAEAIKAQRAAGGPSEGSGPASGQGSGSS
jgi:hypothetical protein